MVTKKIIVLADSTKHGGRCIAGLEITPDGVDNWIRPVSNRSGEAISDQDRKYSNGGLTTYFDVVEIDFVKATPHNCHTENWLIDPTKFWKKIDVINFSELGELVDSGFRLWSNGRHTRGGLNDEMTEELSSQFDYSIGLIWVPHANVIIETENQYGNNRAVRVDFIYDSVQYKLKLTDVDAKDWFLKNKIDGSYRCENCFLTISLSEPIQKTNSTNKFRYKLVAGLRCEEISDCDI